MADDSEFASRDLFPDKIVHKTRVCPRCQGTRKIQDEKSVNGYIHCHLCNRRGYLGDDNDTHIPTERHYKTFNAHKTVSPEDAMRFAYSDGSSFNTSYIDDYMATQKPKKRKREKEEEKKQIDLVEEEKGQDQEKKDKEKLTKEDGEEESYELDTSSSATDRKKKRKTTSQSKGAKSKLFSLMSKSSKSADSSSILSFVSPLNALAESEKLKEKKEKEIKEQKESLVASKQEDMNLFDHCILTRAQQKQWCGKLFSGPRSYYGPPKVFRIVGFTPTQVRIEQITLISSGPQSNRQSIVDKDYLTFHPIVSPLYTTKTIDVEMNGQKTLFAHVEKRDEVSEDDQNFKSWNGCDFRLSLNGELFYHESADTIYTWIEY